MSLRPIISSIGSVTYETAKKLSRILKPLMGKSPHHDKDFIHSLEDIKMIPDECMMSFDVMALSTSVPIEPAINIIETSERRQEFAPQKSHDSETHLLFT